MHADNLAAIAAHIDTQIEHAHRAKADADALYNELIGCLQMLLDMARGVHAEQTKITIFSEDEAAELLKMKGSTLATLRRAGLVYHHAFNSQVVYTAEDITRTLEGFAKHPTATQTKLHLAPRTKRKNGSDAVNAKAA